MIIAIVILACLAIVLAVFIPVTLRNMQNTEELRLQYWKDYAELLRRTNQSRKEL